MPKFSYVFVPPRAQSRATVARIHRTESVACCMNTLSSRFAPLPFFDLLTTVPCICLICR